MSYITEVEELGSIVLDWHENVVSQLDHILVVPDTMAITIDSETEEPYTLQTAHEKRIYLAGIKTAKEIIEVLPIQAVEEEEAPLGVLDLG
jgi:hypothetical protein